MTHSWTYWYTCILQIFGYIEILHVTLTKYKFIYTLQDKMLHVTKKIVYTLHDKILHVTENKLFTYYKINLFDIPTDRLRMDC